LQVNLRNNVHHKQQREYMLVKRFSLIPVLALLGLMSVAAPQQASAQQLKVGYANAEGILPFLTEYNDISQKVQRHVQSSQEVLQAKADAFQADYEKFEKQAELMAADARTAREAQLTNLYAELQQLGADKEQEAMEYEQSLVQPLLAKVQAAIDEVAKEKQLDIVLRAPGILYVNENTIVNITPDVAKRLGLNIDEEMSVN